MSGIYRIKDGLQPRRVANVIGLDGNPTYADIEPGVAFRCADDLSHKRAYEVVEGDDIDVYAAPPVIPSVDELAAMPFAMAKETVKAVTDNKVTARGSADLLTKYAAWIAEREA